MNQNSTTYAIRSQPLRCLSIFPALLWLSEMVSRALDAFYPLFSWFRKTVQFHEAFHTKAKWKKKKIKPKEHRFDGSIRTRHPRTKSKSYRPQIGNWKICVVVDRQNRKIKIETNWMFSVSSCELLLRLWATFKLFSLFAFCFFFFLFFFISASCITNVYVPWMDVRVPPNVLCHCHTIGLWGFEWVSVFVVRNVCI